MQLELGAHLGGKGLLDAAFRFADEGPKFDHGIADFFEGLALLFEIDDSLDVTDKTGVCCWRLLYT